MILNSSAHAVEASSEEVDLFGHGASPHPRPGRELATVEYASPPVPRPYYRCRFPEEYALANRVPHPRNVYLRESWITAPLDDWLTTVFLPHRLDDTIDLMASAREPESTNPAADAARATIADCDAKLATHRTALEVGADPTIVTQWITEAQARRSKTEAALRITAPNTCHRNDSRQISQLVRSISDLAAAVRQADPRDEAEIYRLLGWRLTYAPGAVTVCAELTLDPANDKSPRAKIDRGEMVRVRGGT
jgi:site-specific DNA recombinase